MKPKTSIIDLLNELVEDLSEYPKEYAEWETGFILSIELRIKKDPNYTLSEKQVNKLKELHYKHIVYGEDTNEDEDETTDKDHPAWPF